MAKEKRLYQVTLPNELPLEGLARARYSSMETRNLFTEDSSPERAVRNVVRRQNTDNRLYAITILKALKLDSKENIGVYAHPITGRNDSVYLEVLGNSHPECIPGQQLTENDWEIVRDYF